MAESPDRAVNVALHNGQVLVMRRYKNGRDYCVLPGGGVEDDERPEDAVVRELDEETGLTGIVQRHLATIEHRDRVAHYYLVSVDPMPMTPGGPEALSHSDDNRYTPEWISLNDLESVNLQPESARNLLLQFQYATFTGAQIRPPSARPQLPWTRQFRTSRLGCNDEPCGVVCGERCGAQAAHGDVLVI